MAFQVNIHEAKTQLSQLLQRVSSGEDVIIARAGKPIAYLSRIPQTPGNRKPGSARGLIQMAEDFDAPLPEGIQEDFHS
jgi:antitoxin (DNA-binding transcriptional repressor) of toxin-antitoxin stability system